MIKLLPINKNNSFLYNILSLLIRYGGLLFSDIDFSPVCGFLSALKEDTIKVIAAFNDDKLFAFVALYNFKKVSANMFSCQIYGVSERKNANEADIALKYIFTDLKKQGCVAVRFETRIYNMPMRVMANRLGFRKVGILKNASIFNGKFVDNILYEKIL